MPMTYGIEDHGQQSANVGQIGRASGSLGTAGARTGAIVFTPAGGEAVSSVFALSRNVAKSALAKDITKASVEVAELAATLGAHNISVEALGAVSAADIGMTDIYL